MNKKLLSVLTLIMAIVLVLSLAACNKDKGTDDELEPPEVIRPVPAPAGYDHTINFVCGYARDIDYQPLAETDIFFGENNELAAKTDENGYFEFYFADPGKLTAENQMDYLSLGAEYKCLTMVKSYLVLSEDEQTNNIVCFVVAADADSEINLQQVVLVRDPGEDGGRADMSIDIRIGTDDVILPAGYIHRGAAFSEQTLTSNDEYSLYGAKVKINGNYVTESDSFGCHFDFLIKGMILEFEYEGFVFEESRDNNNNIMVKGNNRFEILGLHAEGAKIIAETQDLDIINNTYGQ
jgi:hypothetical protein